MLTLAQAELKGRSEVLAPSPRRARRRRRKRRRGKLGQALAQAQVLGYFDRELEKTKTRYTCNSELEEAPPAPQVVTKSDSGITRHLKTTPEY